MADDWRGHQIGDVVFTDSIEVSREMVVRYAGASGDFNPIHYRDDFAKSVGLDGVLAHGMLTMGLAISALSEWLGDAALIMSYQVRFTKPLYIPLEGSAKVSVSVSLSDVRKDESVAASLALNVTREDGAKLLGKSLLEVANR